MKHLNTITTLMICLLMSAGGQAYGSVWKTGDVRGFLGIQSETLSKEKARVLGFDNIYGNYVTRVLGNTAAEKAGLTPFDYVYGVNDERTSASRDIADLLRAHKPGEEVTVHFVRNGTKQRVQLTLGKESDAQYREYKEEGRPFLGINRHPDNEEDEIGVKVYVIGESTAEQMGLKDGDVITALNGYPMVDWSDISTAIANMEIGQNIRVGFEREGREMELSSAIQSRSETRSYSSNWTQRESAFFGIYSSDVSKEKAKKLGFDNPYGSYVTSVIGNTAAEKAGIQPFDYIYGIDEYRTGEDQNLSAILRKYEPNDEAEIHLIRKRQKKTISVALGRRSDARSKERSDCEDPFLGVSQISNSSSEGVAVSIVEKSTAEAIGMPKGAVITKINGYTIIDFTDIGTAVDNMNIGETITVEYLEDGRSKTASGSIKSYCETKTKTNKLFNWDWNFDFDRDQEGERSYREREQSRRDISGMRVEVGAIPASEARDLQTRYDLDLPATNNLQVEQLQFSPDSDRGLFELTFNLRQRGETTVKIYNKSGRQIYEYDLGSFAGEFSDEVDLSQNGPGNYYLLIRQSGDTFSRKITLK